ncbi:hypothetical protein EYC80_007763 [Monilinia laxa]|uniref:Uncharacterized protein n=1 Tax=Monilinia laxa TaxID=61186 RepID=A0A5N6JWX4_MONLA|nr:hypothetical protein EYC80_007763 [Monilinia laxa]
MILWLRKRSNPTRCWSKLASSGKRSVHTIPFFSFLILDSFFYTDRNAWNGTLKGVVKGAATGQGTAGRETGLEWMHGLDGHFILCPGRCVFIQ